MFITKLKLDYFGRFHKKEIELKPGINLIYGNNEAGKSTLHAFIKGMLFGIDRMRGRGASSKEDIYSRYLPWNYPGAFQGSMDITIGGENYRLQRSFHANDKYFTVLKLQTGRDVTPKEGAISELIPGLTEAAFKNTVSIEQLKAGTDEKLAAQVRDYITNLSIAKSKEVNVTGALSFLSDQKKQLEANQSRINQELKLLKEEMEQETLIEEKLDTISLQLKEFLKEEYRLKQQLNEVEKIKNKEEEDLIEQLPAILVKFRSYQKLSEQCKEMEIKCSELQERIEAFQTDRIRKEILVEVLTNDIRIAEQLKMEQLDKGKIQSERKLEYAQVQKKDARKRFLFGILPFSIYLLLLLIMNVMGMNATDGSKTSILGMGGVLLVAIGAVLYGMIYKAQKKNQKQIQDQLSELSDQLNIYASRLDNIQKKYNVFSTQELYNKKEQIQKSRYEEEYLINQQKELKTRLNDAEDNRDVFYDAVMTYMQHFLSEDELTENSMQRLKECIEQKKRESLDKQAQTYKQYENCRINIEKLKWELSSMEGNENKLLLHKEQYKQQLEKQKENETELSAVKLAFNAIKELSVDIHDTFGLKLNKAVSDIMKEVTDGKYTDLKVNEKLELKVGINRDYIPFERLSAGTIDQVYFSLRLAVADLLFQEEMPLLLDDSFALYDDKRLEAALKEIAGWGQTIIFSCHTREQKLLEEGKLPYHLVELS